MHFLILFLTAATGFAQIALEGTSYSQNFDSLAASGSNVPWSNDSTLPGWYLDSTGGVHGDYSAGTGSSLSGDFYSFGSSLSTERALGSLASTSTGTLAIGVSFINSTGFEISAVSVSFTAEQWRTSGAAAQTLSFFYQTSASLLTSSDAASTQSWIPFTNLNATSPVFSGTVGAIDGNLSANQVVFTNASIPLSLRNGESLFLRWLDLNDPNNDHALAIDNFTLNCQTVPEPSPFWLLIPFFFQHAAQVLFKFLGFRIPMKSPLFPANPSRQSRIIP